MRIRGGKQIVAGSAVAVVAVALGACSSSPTTSAPSSTSTATSGATSTAAALSGTLNGAGSSFQNTFQQAAIAAFKSVQSGITVNYNSVGSGTGRTDLASNVVQFAGSDSPIPASEASSFKKTVLYFPILIGPITMSYNLSGVSNLKLTPAVIAQMFSGKITNWDDSAITSINPGVKLPNEPITLAVRSDSSGTTQNFALFLQTAAPSDWSLGDASTVKWPAAARAGAQNTGVAQIIKSTPGAIGYVDYADAKASGLTFASVQNKSGNYIAPSVSAASASAAGVTVAPNLTFHAVWGSGATAYPITYQTWVLVYESQSNANTAKLLQSYIGYLLGDGQSLLTSLGYAPLPASIDSMAKAQLSKIGS